MKVIDVCWIFPCSLTHSRKTIMIATIKGFTMEKIHDKYVCVIEDEIGIFAR